METTKSLRQSNFEILRIISMLMIIGHHVAMHGGYSSVESVVISDYIIRLFTIGGKLGVNIFVLISGYFLINSKFKIKKALTIFAQVFFYSVLISSIFLIFGKVQFSKDLLLSMLLPISLNVWWFVSIYFITYCLSPFLNILVKNCGQKLHLILIFFLLVVQCIVNNVLGVAHLSNVAWFITLYLISAYIKIYPHKLFNSNKIAVPVSLGTLVIIAVFNVFLKVNLWEMVNFVCLVCSVAIFCSFKNFTIPNSKIINAIAKTTFGIYLIHDHPLVRSFLWVELLKCPYHYQLNTFICFVIVAIIAVFIACMIIDFIRELLFKAVIIIIKRIRRKKPITE
ncbi:MAG: acyltransferase [Clostridia bacterium]|nr:acyltransferase [Clostridia bacterium]